MKKIRNFILLLLIVGITISSSFAFNYSYVSAQAAKPGMSVGTDPTSWWQEFKTSVEQTISTATGLKAFFKDTVLKKLAMTIVRGMIKQLTSDIVDWINSGFEGEPAFVTDLGGTLLNVADEEFGRFIDENTDFGFLCEPFRLELRIALATSPRKYRERSRCSLTSISENVTGFVTGNNSGGWDTWLAQSIQPQNNPYGAFLLAENEISVRIAGRKNLTIKPIQWGNGFLSKKVCEQVPRQTAGEDGLGAFEEKCKMVTPGSLISDQLSFTMDSERQSLIQADDIDEIVNALLNQMVKQALSGVGGLLGASRSSNSNNSLTRTYLQDARNSGVNNLNSTTTSQNYIDQRINDAQNQFDNDPSNPRNSANTDARSGVDSTGSDEDGVISTGKLASQSSVQGDAGAHLAVDGSIMNTVNTYYSNMSKTIPEYRPWWQVDLGKNYSISKIVITPSADPGNYPLENFHVFISGTPFNEDFNPIASDMTGVWKSNLIQPRSPYNNDIQIDANQVGRYLRVQEIDFNSLQIAEVRIFGKQAPSGASGTGTVGNPISPSSLPTIEFDPARGETLNFTKNTSCAGISVGFGMGYGSTNNSNSVSPIGPIYSNSMKAVPNSTFPKIKISSTLYGKVGNSFTAYPWNTMFNNIKMQIDNKGTTRDYWINSSTGNYQTAQFQSIDNGYPVTIRYIGNIYNPHVNGSFQCDPGPQAGNYQIRTTLTTESGTVINEQISDFTIRAQ